jgi:hypothetical protein
MNCVTHPAIRMAVYTVETKPMPAKSAAWSESLPRQRRVQRKPLHCPDREARRRRLRVFVGGAGGESKELSVIGSNPGFHINKLPIRGSLELMGPDWDSRRK